VTTAVHTVAAELDPDLEARLEQRRERAATRLRARSRRSAITLLAVFAGACVGLAALVDTDRSPSLLTVIALVGAYALASRVEFEVRTGLTLPTQLILVPMLFLLPLPYVPLFVAAGLLLGRLPEIIRVSPSRALLVGPNAFHALGPVAVLALAGEAAPSLEHWWLYLTALAAQFAADFIGSGAHQWYVNGVSPHTALPFMSWAFLVDAALAPVGLAVALAAQQHPAAVVLVLPLLALLGEFARERRARIDHTLELSHAYRGTAMLLGDVVEADDAYTGSHSRDVVTLVLDVCDRLGLNARDRRDAEFAALLHDVGKIRVPGEIINKPGPLTPKERAVMEAHTVEGEKLLSQVGGLLGNVGRIVRSCHEDWDGTGYPDGIAGEEIPLAARIVRCCDAFSAMTTDRPYRKARPVDEAVAELRRCSGTDFDPAVVEALAEAVAQPA
jgi:HD-GYP domain-containing protein (c-di-GMP phosphodiesterase class II)